MYPYYMDSTMLLILPAFVLAMWAQYNVKSTFKKYSNVSTHNGKTAAEVASMLLQRAGIPNITVNRVAGQLTDHYDPRKKTIGLSESVYGSTSIASIGVAAHECGHAIQHNIGYSPLMIRNAIVPVINLSSNLWILLVMLGFFLNAMGLVMFGIMLFAGVIVFHLITLPVEFNASSRALAMLNNTGTLSSGELVGARAVLRAAAWTYVAAAVMAVMQLLRLILVANRRR